MSVYVGVAMCVDEPGVGVGCGRHRIPRILRNIILVITSLHILSTACLIV